MYPPGFSFVVLLAFACAALLAHARPLSSDIPEWTDINDDIIWGAGLSRGNALDASVVVDTFQTGMTVPKTLFGVFFEVSTKFDPPSARHVQSYNVLQKALQVLEACWKITGLAGG
jgi:hypothetical protein